VALLSQDGGVAARVVEKAGVAPATLLQRLQQAIEKCRACPAAARRRARSSSRRA